LFHTLCVFLGASLLLLSVFFCFVCCNKWLDPNKFLLEKTHSVFHLLRTLYFSLLSFNECSLFLELRLAFVFCLDFYSNLGISLHQGVFRPLFYVGFHQKSCLKKVWMVLEKRKKFHAKSGTKRSLFRLWLRLLHAMLDVFLIVCLVVFAVAWLVSNDWDCLMSLWKKSYIVFIIWKHLFGFLLDALFGLTWRMLTTCLTLTSRHKPLWLFGFWLVMPLYASFNDVLSLCIIMAIIALLVGHSQSFASLRFIPSMSSTSASNSQKPSYSNVSTINSYAWYLQAIPSKFSCATFKTTFKTLLVLWHCFQLMEM
jgi:hypothetical protein